MLHKTLFGALVASLIGPCLLTGCASPFARFYDGAPNSYGTPATAPATPVLIQSRYPNVDAKQLAQEGYVLIGTSSFATGQLATGPLEEFYKDQAMTQGMRVGAAIVLLQVDYTSVLADGCCAKVFASYWGDLPRT